MVNTTATVDASPSSLNAENYQLATFLKEHEEVEMIVPVLLGLFITSRLQLRGANALLVNLGIASVLRQVFKQLKNTELSAAPSPPQSVNTPAPPTMLGEGITILHSVPGRLRLRIDQLAVDPVFAKRLERLLNNDDHVISVRINRTVASIVINYEAGNLSDLDLGFKLMGIVNEARMGEAT
ncbi:MAG: hypothetical protein VKJ02_18335 [Snowella sp.]|nr:hypothetical protein [Snowella sp.]